MAATGFLVHGICAKDSTTALYALGEAFPQFLGSTPPVMCNLSAQSFTAPNTFSQRVSCHDLTGAPQYIFNHPISLPMCDPLLVDIGQVFDPVLAGAFWSFAMTFIFGCWLLAKNAGVILSAIRRF